MKKNILPAVFLLALFLLSGIVFAEGEQVLFSGAVASGEIDVSGQKAFVTITSTLVRVKYMDRIIVSPNGQCKDEEGIILCVSSIEAPFQASITLKAAVASISVEKSFTSKTYSVGDLINVKTTIKNSGKGSASRLKLVDDFSGFGIVNPRGCTIVDDKLIYETNALGPGGSAVCEYSLKVASDTPRSKIAEVAYFDGLKEGSASASASFTISPFGFDIKSSLDNQKLELGKINKIWFNLTLKSPRETKVNNLLIEFPPSLKVVDKDGKEMDKFSWTGLIDVKKSIYFEYNATVLKMPSREQAVLTMDFVADKIGSQLMEYPINISYNKPIISLRQYNFSSGSGTDAVYIKNDNKYDIINVKLKVSSSKIGFESNEFSVDSIKAGAEIKIAELKFNAPAGVSGFYAALTFKIKDGPEMRVNDAFNININPALKKEDIAVKDIKETIVIDTTNKTNVVKEEKKGFLCRVLGWMIKGLC